MKWPRRSLLSAAAMLFALPAVSQPSSRVWSVGLLSGFHRPGSLDAHPLYGALLHRLAELGYVEGKNLRIVSAFAEGDDGRLPELASDLVAQHVDAIVTNATPGVRAAQAVTRTIPIVFVGGADVVAQGFVRSLAHPGGNTTGFSYLVAESTEKQVEILAAFVPRLSRVGYLFNPTNPAGTIIMGIARKAAEKLGGEIVPLEVRSKDEFEAAFSAAATRRVEALICGTDVILLEEFGRIARLAANNRLPSIGMFPEFAQEGGLAAYGPDRPETFRLVAAYLDRIFKGERPGDLPVQQPTKLDLVINRRTAQALGFEIPPALLVQADRVVD